MKSTKLKTFKFCEKCDLHIFFCENMKDVINYPYIMNAVEIKGNAILCFEENGYQFQGIIQTDNNAQYTVYGTRSKRREARKMSRVLCEKGICSYCLFYFFF